MNVAGIPDVVLRDGERIWRVASLVKGTVEHAAALSLEELEAGRRKTGQGLSGTFRLGQAQVLFEPVPGSRPAGTASGFAYFVLHRPDPRRLLEADPVELARGLHALPFSEILRFAASLKSALEGAGELFPTFAGPGAAGAPVAASLRETVFRLLPGMLHSAGLEEMVDVELGAGKVPGHEYLDGWVSG